MTKEEMTELLELWHTSNLSTIDPDKFERMLTLRDKLVTSILG